MKRAGMSRLSNAWRIALAMLHEIFDESAYSRFLQRARLQSSPAAYAAFWRERENNPAQPKRCC
jgi:hypothetical protein